MRHHVKVLLAVFIFLFSVPTIASSLQYTVIIDAGSSGSRAHVFEYAQSLPMIPVPVIKDIYNKSTTPGLSSYATDPAAAGASLKPILDAAASVLQTKGINLAQVSISVLGTAGMRALPQLDQDAIYASVVSYIQINYAFALSVKNVRTITGIMEGVYGWLDVNYLLNNFIHPPLTVGSIDMGGSSTQIAFATNDNSQPDNLVLVTINHTPYRVFSQSFLGLGLNAARNTMTAQADAASCYPAGYNYSGMDVGFFNFSPCSVIYASLLQYYNVSENILPTTGVSFIASSGVYYTYKFFNVVQNPSQSALESQINVNCYLSWDQLKLNYPYEPDSLLSGYCANAVYLDDLLYTTYQLHTSQLRVSSELNGTGIDWTLGALLYALV